MKFPQNHVRWVLLILCGLLVISTNLHASESDEDPSCEKRLTDWASTQKYFVEINNRQFARIGSLSDEQLSERIKELRILADLVLSRIKNRPVQTHEGFITLVVAEDRFFSEHMTLDEIIESRDVKEIIAALKKSGIKENIWGSQDELPPHYGRAATIIKYEYAFGALLAAIEQNKPRIVGALIDSLARLHRFFNDLPEEIQLALNEDFSFVSFRLSNNIHIPVIDFPRYFPKDRAIGGEIIVEVVDADPLNEETLESYRSFLREELANTRKRIKGLLARAPLPDSPEFPKYEQSLQYEERSAATYRSLRKRLIADVGVIRGKLVGYNGSGFEIDIGGKVVSVATAQSIRFVRIMLKPK